MIFSPEKKEDMSMRALMLEAQEVALRAFVRAGKKELFEYAKDIGESSRKLGEQISHGDYTERDARRRRVDEIINRRVLFPS